MKNLFRFLAPLLLIAGLGTPAYSAGTIPLSLSQQFDSQGKPLGGCQLYTIQAGTVSTPQNSYQDTALSIPLPNPIPCDAAGRLPQFFLADGQIKVRLTDKNGIVQLQADNILVIGPSSGGGGGGGQVDPTTIAQTGDVKYRYDDASVAGWVRANGRTIGSASSGATERANADCQALFEYLWGKDSTLVVSGGRGASAAADWAANKTIALPDARGRTMASLAGMGASDSGIFNGVTFTKGDATTLGSMVGAPRHSLVAANIPAHTHSGTTATNNEAHTHLYLYAAPQLLGLAGGGESVWASSSAQWVSTQGQSQNHTHNFTTNSGNGLSGSAFDTNSPFLLVTTYIKL